VPELPEVESVRRQLAPLLEGRRFERVEVTDPRLTRPDDPAAVARSLEGERVAVVERRGKYLVVRFESGRALLIHLRMTGSLRHVRAGSPADDPYTRAVVRLDDGSDVAYRDIRRFGTWTVLERGEEDAYLEHRLGAEPLGRAFTAARLGARLANRRAPVKSAILDQRTLAGVGNIYADEALWYASVHPLREARSLDEVELAALHRGIRRALARGIERQGSTLRDYRLPDGASGAMQHEFKVYGREGEPCDRCVTPIEKIRVAGRGTWYCPSCQRPPAARAERPPARTPQAASSSSKRPSRSSWRSSE
jgi:formamidopyrimidine-DNA glycosylase